MAPRSSVFIVMAICLVLLCLMSRQISATSRRLISQEDAAGGGNYNEKITPQELKKKKKKKKMRMEDYGSEDDRSPPHDYSDYDFYRKHGDVPSPGAGH